MNRKPLAKAVLGASSVTTWQEAFRVQALKLALRNASLEWERAVAVEALRFGSSAGTWIGGSETATQGFYLTSTPKEASFALLSVRREQKRNEFDSAHTKNLPPGRFSDCVGVPFSMCGVVMPALARGLVFLFHLESRRQRQPIRLRNATGNTSAGFNNRADSKAGTLFLDDYASCLTSCGRNRCRRGLADRVPKGVPSSEPCPKSNNVLSRRHGPRLGFAVLQPT